ncbi:MULTISPECIES: hypothetical protein [unclassified Chelatococcus]|uniref:hypothetical protein n=1 Tax=unclassified Chelatococcus TaxID=2638111 RepID=UPI001BCE0F84|nr:MULTISPECIES: hypothetical protein [unclassified Chelatococcus]MBS7698905.1 hypothetical protein [Chelatococcus sp. YT9]MBX3559518.1 hypothetical protein [Chelatococcus sp.]
MAEIIFSYKDSYMFSDLFNNKKLNPPRVVNRLTLVAHGVGGSVLIDGVRMNAMDFFSFSRRFIDPNDLDYIRLESCYSTWGGGSSFASELSKIFERGYVKGYMRQVWVWNIPDQVFSNMQQYGLKGASVMLTKEIMLGYSIAKGYADFHSMVFRRGRVIKERILNPYI